MTDYAKEWISKHPVNAWVYRHQTLVTACAILTGILVFLGILWLKGASLR